MKPTIFLVDDHAVMREGIRSILTHHPDIEIVGEARDGKEAIDRVRELRPNIVIIDISMPGMNGIDATRHLLDENPGINIIALSAYDDKRYVIEMLGMGAKGYLLKEDSTKEILAAIEAVMHGKMYVSPGIGAAVIKECLDRIASGKPAESLLTPKEKEILKLIAEGKHNNEIAGYLNLSPKTVESHRMHLMEKLNLHNIADLTRYAIKEGIVRIE